MRYYDLSSRIEGEKVKEIKQNLLGGKKNKDLKTFRDYYNGIQWEYNGFMTDSTRSGKRVWNIHKKHPNDLGVGEGDLQVFNVCDTTVNIYSSYARGGIDGNNRVSIEDNDELARRINDLINLDTLIPRTITRFGVDSFAVWKYKEDGTIDFVDALEVFPIYHGENRVGTVRIYSISPNDPLIKNNDIKVKPNTSVDYMEIWYPKDGVMWLDKYINEEHLEAESGKAPFDFDPHIYVNNKDNEFIKLDENNLEVSDVGRLITVQDALNKTITEEGIIISKVAFPMIKVIKEIYEKMASGEIDADVLKKQLSEVSLVAGKIISAPIEREKGQDLPSGVDKYVDIIFEQIYRLTGIPKSIFVSEGMSNISEKTMSAMMESLKRRVDEKRTNIENAVKEYVVMYTGNPQIKDAVSVEWAEMFAMSKEEQAELIIKAHQYKVFPINYSLEKLLDILGDGERLSEVLGIVTDSDINMKINIERERIMSQSQREIQAKEKQIEKEREARRRAETDSALLSREIEDITSNI